MTDSHGNKISGPRRADPNPPTIRKVPADSVPFGSSVSRNGKTVIAAYDGERLVCIGSTVEEARRKYRELQLERERALSD